MKTTVMMILIAIVTLLPAVFIGIKHFDGSLSDSYEKGLVYDKTKSIVAGSEIRWGDAGCEKNRCKAGLFISPKPDANSVDIKIFRPTDGRQLMTNLSGNGEHWLIEFQIERPGWYVERVEYRYQHNFVSDENAFYMDNK